MLTDAIMQYMFSPMAHKRNCVSFHHGHINLTYLSTVLHLEDKKASFYHENAEALSLTTHDICTGRTEFYQFEFNVNHQARRLKNKIVDH